MRKIYSVTVDEITPSAVDFVKKNYPERYKKSLEYRDENDAKLCLCVALLLNSAGIKESELAFENSGKPCLFDGRFLSISHSGKYCFLAVFNKEVGIDVEKVGRVGLAVATRFFTEKERAWAQNDEVRLTVLWTLKEALSKLSGRKIHGAGG